MNPEAFSASIGEKVARPDEVSMIFLSHWDTEFGA